MIITLVNVNQLLWPANHKGYRQSNEPIKTHSKLVADVKRRKTCIGEALFVVVPLLIG